MPALLIRNLEPAEIVRLKNQARQAGRSLQEEALRVLRESAGGGMDEARRLALRVRRQFKGRRFSDSARLVRRDRAGRER